MARVNKAMFLRMVAERANFTLGDVKDIWEVIESIFQEAIELGYDIDIQGFGHLKIIDYAARHNYDPKTKQWVYMPATKMVRFSVSHNLRDILRDPRVRKIQNNSKKTKENLDNNKQSNLE